MQQNKSSKIVINPELCIKCKKCESDCTSLAISIDSFTVDATCIACGHCVAICDSKAITMSSNQIVDLQNNIPTPEQFYNLSTHTRTCRHFTSKQVDSEILKQLIDNISHCPSASNTRRVELTVITNPDTIKKLNDYTAGNLLRLFKKVTNPIISNVIGLFISKAEVKKIGAYRELFEKKIAKNTDNITYKAPVVIIFHGPKQKTGMLQIDADIWATYTSLYSSTFGLGTCFNGFIVKALKKHKRAKIEFGIPANHDVFISLLIGYPQYSYSNETSRNAPHFTLIK